MTAIDIALIALGRVVNAALAVVIGVALFTFGAVAAWPAYERAGVGPAVCALAIVAAALRLSRREGA